jgi:hypothetical protein
VAALLGQPFESLQGEGFAMSFPMEEFQRQSAKEHVTKLTPEECRQALVSLAPDEPRKVLQSLPVEELLTLLSAEQIQQVRDRLALSHVDPARHWMKGCFAGFVAFGLVACSAVGIWRAFVDLPGISAPPPRNYVGPAGVTWLVQDRETAWSLGILLLIIIYVGKRWISRFPLTVPAKALWYCLGMVCSLPNIWFLVVLDWQSPFVYRVSCWVYDPIAIWFIPTASFAWDVTRRTPCTGRVYLLRSAFEISLFIPIWVVFWLTVSFFLLGGGWI